MSLRAPQRPRTDHQRAGERRDDDADDDVRMNELTDRTVQEVLHKLGL